MLLNPVQTLRPWSLQPQNLILVEDRLTEPCTLPEKWMKFEFGKRSVLLNKSLTA